MGCLSGVILGCFISSYDEAISLNYCDDIFLIYGVSCSRLWESSPQSNNEPFANLLRVLQGCHLVA